jgi:hypothetical protein
MNEMKSAQAEITDGGKFSQQNFRKLAARLQLI